MLAVQLLGMHASLGVAQGMLPPPPTRRTFQVRLLISWPRCSTCRGQAGAGATMLSRACGRVGRTAGCAEVRIRLRLPVP